jgi:hypothetical protein
LCDPIILEGIERLREKYENQATISLEYLVAVLELRVVVLLEGESKYKKTIEKMF